MILNNTSLENFSGESSFLTFNLAQEQTFIINGLELSLQDPLNIVIQPGRAYTLNNVINLTSQTVLNVVPTNTTLARLSNIPNGYYRIIMVVNSSNVSLVLQTTTQQIFDPPNTVTIGFALISNEQVSSLSTQIPNGEQVLSSGIANYVDENTPQTLLSKIEQVDGPGSGLNADLLDGLQASQFARVDIPTTFSNNVTIQGILSVSGEVSYLNSQQLNIENNFITLNSNFTSGTPVANAGIEVLRGSSPTVSLIWNETQKAWQSTADGVNYYDILLNGSNVNAQTLSGQPITYFAPESQVQSHITNFNNPHQVTAAQLGAQNILNQILTVDGPASGLNADLLDGQQGSYYAPAAEVEAHITNYNNPHQVTAAQLGATNILAQILTVDGSGSGLNADLLDGLQASQFARSDIATIFASNVTVNGTLLAYNLQSTTSLTLNYASSPENTSINVLRSSEPTVSIRWTENNQDWELTNDGNNFYHILTTNDELNINAGMLGGQLPSYYASENQVESHITNYNNPHQVTAAQLGAQNILNQILTVDGPGSKLNADLLDNLESGQFARTDIATTFSNNVTIDGTLIANNIESNSSLTLNSNTTGTPSQNGLISVIRGSSPTTSIRWTENNQDWELTNDGTNFYHILTTNDEANINAGMLGGQNSSYYAPESQVESHITNYNNPHQVTAAQLGANNILAQILTVDGPGSKLNADLLDGLESTQFARSDIATTFASNVTIQGNLNVIGTTSNTNVENLNVSTNTVQLNSETTGTPVLNAYINVIRGSSPTTSIRWTEANQDWELTNNGTNFYHILTTNDEPNINAGMLGGQLPTYYAPESQVESHITNYNNPHQVTAAQLGAQNILNQILTVDGPGSKLNADLLDNLESTQFARTDIATTFASNVTVNGNLLANMLESNSSISLNYNTIGTPTQNASITVVRGSNPNVSIMWNETNKDWELTENGTNFYHILTTNDESNINAGYLGGQPISYFAPESQVESHITNYNNPHHVTAAQLGASNILAQILTVDGPGSGLNADLLDNLQSTQFARTDIATVFSNNVTIQGTLIANNINSNSSIQLNYGTTGTPSQNGLISVIRGSSPTTSIRWTENNQDWELTNDGTHFYHILTTNDETNINAGLLGGQPITYFAPESQVESHITNYNNPHQVTAVQLGANNILAQILTVDGQGSGLDADLLDGQQGSYYAPESQVESHITNYNNPHQVTAAQLGANNILDQILTVDGSGSGLDADLLDGQQGSYYAPQSEVQSHITNYNNPHQVTAAQIGANNILAQILTVDGQGSGLNADLLDGQHASYFAAESQVESHITNYNNPHQVTAAQLGASNILAQILTVDGQGSGLNADMLQGYKPALQSTPNSVVVALSNGYIDNSWINYTPVFNLQNANNLIRNSNFSSWSQPNIPDEWNINMTANNVSLTAVSNGLQIQIGVNSNPFILWQLIPVANIAQNKQITSSISYSTTNNNIVFEIFDLVNQTTATLNPSNTTQTLTTVVNPNSTYIFVAVKIPTSTSQQTIVINNMSLYVGQLLNYEPNFFDQTIIYGSNYNLTNYNTYTNLRVETGLVNMQQNNFGYIAFQPFGKPFRKLLSLSVTLTNTIDGYSGTMSNSGIQSQSLMYPVIINSTTSSAFICSIYNNQPGIQNLIAQWMAIGTN